MHALIYAYANIYFYSVYVYADYIADLCQMYKLIGTL